MSHQTDAGLAPLAGRHAQAASARRPLRAVGAASSVAVRVAVEAGFDALWVSGLEVSTALGLPDENVIGPRGLADTVPALSRTLEPRQHHAVPFLQRAVWRELSGKPPILTPPGTRWGDLQVGEHLVVPLPVKVSVLN